MEILDEIKPLGITKAVDLVPDVILHIVEENGFLNDAKSLLNLRLISTTWNETLRHIVGTRMVTILYKSNLDSFSQFLSSDVCTESQSTNIRAVVLNLGSNPDDARVILTAFAQLPQFFRAHLLRLKLRFEYAETHTTPDFSDVWKFLHEGEFNSLQEFEMVVDIDEEDYETLRIPFPSVHIPTISSPNTLRFENLRKLVCPLHVSTHLLRACSSGLEHLSLHVFDVELCSDFWNSFKEEIIQNSLNESLIELYFIDKRADPNDLIDMSSCFVELYECSFHLKKLGLNVGSELKLTQRIKEFVLFLAQQSATVESLELSCGLRNGRDGGVAFYEFIAARATIFTFPKLIELKLNHHTSKIEKLLEKCPALESITMPCVQQYGTVKNLWNSEYKPLTLKNVTLKYPPCLYDLSDYVPNIQKLVIQEFLNHDALGDVFGCLTELKELSIQMEYNTVNEREWKRCGYLGYYEPDYSQDYPDDRRFQRHQRTIKADCIFLGLKPSYCRPFLSGQVAFNDTTEFQIPTICSIVHLQNLECLNVKGYLTELTLWAGIKKLNKLKKFHLKSQHLIHPRSFFKLESHLAQLNNWSYTKLAKVKNGYREMYKCFRVQPSVLGVEQFHIWKFNDEKVETRLVTLDEFDDLDLTYTGTKSELVIEEFSEAELSESDLEEYSSPDSDSDQE